MAHGGRVSRLGRCAGGGNSRALNDPFKREEEQPKLRNPRQAALQTVVKNYLADPKIMELLHDRAINDPDEEVRSFAKEQLAKLE